MADELDAYVAEAMADPVFAEAYRREDARVNEQQIRTRFRHVMDRRWPVFVLGARVPLRLRLQAARHELRCWECRVSWRSWARRLLNDRAGYSPRA